MILHVRSRFRGRKVIRHVHFQQFRTVDAKPCALADNLGREDEILQEFLVHACQSPAAGTLLLYTGGTGGLAEDATLADEHDVTIREFLLKFTGEPSYR